MQLDEVRMMVKQGEGLHLEFKHKAADPQKIMREVVAFSNASGGWLLVGVDDNGHVCGLKDAEEEAFALEQAMARFCKPAPQYRLYRVPVNRKRLLLAFRIEECPQKPMFLIYNERAQRGRAYFRVADRSIQASRELRRILKLRQQPQGTGFQYGEAEQRLMALLRQQPRITLAHYAAAANLPLPEASETLVRLTAAQVLDIYPEEQEDAYALAADAQMA